MCGLAFNYISNNPPALLLLYAVQANKPGACSLQGVVNKMCHSGYKAPTLQARSDGRIDSGLTSRMYILPAIG